VSSSGLEDTGTVESLPVWGLDPEAATGAGDGLRGGVPVPVAAELGSLDDELDTLIWSEDPSLGEPQGPPAGRPVDASTDEVDLSSAVQPGSDAAGTGTSPDPVPVAQIDRALHGPWVAVLCDSYGELYDAVEEIEDGTLVEIAVARESATPKDDRSPGTYYAADVLYRLDGYDFEDGTDEDLADRWVQAQAVARLLNGGGLVPVEDANAWAKAAAPLVPAVETQETVS
jgi:hypothetical protein